MHSEISNIIIEDEFIIIVTLDGDKHTIAIDNDNDTHKTFVDNILSMATSLVNETEPDKDMDMDGLYGVDSPKQWGAFGNDEYDD
tara:strand:+ start:201 stop:455 length:255 start_codon:yes stop_codon:yes gene_type:complete